MTKPNSNRRSFLRGAIVGGAGLLAASCGSNRQPEPTACPEPPACPEPEAPETPGAQAQALPDGLDVQFFHLHTRQPLTLEAKRSSIGVAAITPMSRFFVRNNLPMPDASIVADPESWKISIEGVAKPRELTVRELMGLGAEVVTTVVQCSGNGRKFYEHGPSGSQWATGAAGCAMWTGVPIHKVVAHLGGLAKGAKFMTSTGGDPLPDGVNPLDVIVERSVPVEKGMQDCMLCWEMNGQPIPLSHGGPLRLIVPGYYGCNQIKYIKKLAFTTAQTSAKIQRSGYRMRPIGQKGDPSQPSLWSMNIKSWINGPGADGQPVLNGDVELHGVALGGEEGVRGVEVSIDGGKSWKKARLIGPDMGPYAWRPFVLSAPLKPGTYKVASRATSVSGKTQPESRNENERGYGNNAWRDHILEVQVVDKLPEKTAAKPAAGTGAAPDKKVAAKKVELSEGGKRGRELFTSEAQPSCTACHTLQDAGSTGAVGPNLDELAPDIEKVKAAVTNGVGSMPPYKGNLSDKDIADVAKYVWEATKK